MGNSEGRKLGNILLTKLLGQGAMGAVYQGRQLSLGRDVAVKVILPVYADNLTYIKRFEREARLVAQLTHQNITQIYEFGKFDGFYLIIMELVEGVSLKKLFSSEKEISVENVCEMLFQISRGIKACESQNIVHRDIKPENIQITKKGICKILDFGLAKAETGDTQMTKDNGLLGTPSFMSPEQCRGNEVTFQSDMYCLGATAYFLLTGEPPFKAETPLAVLNMHCNEAVPDPRTINPKIPDDLAELIMKLLSKKPKDRCKSVGHVVKAFKNILGTMSSFIPLSNSVHHWDWDGMISLDSSAGLSALDNYIVDPEATIASANNSKQAMKTQDFYTETVASGSSFQKTINSKMGDTLQPTGVQRVEEVVELRQFDEDSNSLSEKKSSNPKQMAFILLFIGCLLLFILYLAFKGPSEKDWSNFESQFEKIRLSIKQDRFNEIQRARDMLRQNYSYPHRVSLEKEIEVWDQLAVSYVEYNDLLVLAANKEYKRAFNKGKLFVKKWDAVNPYYSKVVSKMKLWNDQITSDKQLISNLQLKLSDIKRDNAINKLKVEKLRQKKTEQKTTEATKGSAQISKEASIYKSSPQIEKEAASKNKKVNSKPKKNLGKAVGGKGNVFEEEPEDEKENKVKIKPLLVEKPEEAKNKTVARDKKNAANPILVKNKKNNPDLIISSLFAKVGRKGKVQVTYEIANYGQASIRLKGREFKSKGESIVLKAYASTDTKLQEDQDELIADVILKGKNTAVLKPGATKRGSFTAISIGKKILNYPYLILKVSHTYKNIKEVNEFNNLAIVGIDIGKGGSTDGPNLRITGITASRLKKGVISQTYTVTNVGDQLIDLNNKCIVQAYTSADSVLSARTDIAAGGGTIGSKRSGPIILKPGESKSFPRGSYYRKDEFNSSFIIIELKGHKQEKHPQDNFAVIGIEEDLATIQKDKAKVLKIDANFKPEPNPVISYLKSEDNKKSVRHYLTVTNKGQFSKDLFERSKRIPAFGSYKNRVRTHVSIYSADGKHLYGFIGFRSPDSLKSIWFSSQKGPKAIKKVYIVLTDRLYNKKYKSNIIEIP